MEEKVRGEGRSGNEGLTFTVILNNTRSWWDFSYPIRQQKYLFPLRQGMVNLNSYWRLGKDTGVPYVSRRLMCIFSNNTGSSPKSLLASPV